MRKEEEKIRRKDDMYVLLVYMSPPHAVPIIIRPAIGH
jgi:hypothetical protein